MGLTLLLMLMMILRADRRRVQMSSLRCMNAIAFWISMITPMLMKRVKRQV